MVIGDLVGDLAVARAAARRLAESGDKIGAMYDALWSGDIQRAAALAMASVESEAVNADSPWYAHVNLGRSQLALGRAWAAANDPRSHDMLASAVAELEIGAPYELAGVARRWLGVARRELAALRGREPRSPPQGTSGGGGL